MTVQAAADLSAQADRFKGVTLAGTLMPAATAAGASGRVGGILETSCRSGEYASLVYRGITKVIAGAAVSTLGYPIAVGSNGFVFAVASGAGHSGRALETAASGDLFQALVDFSTFPAWTGV
jgi:hypothetical protein